MIPLLWCDLETTGLNEHVDKILEIAIVATDEKLQVEAILNHHIFITERLLAELLPEDSEVRKMHTDSGLLALCTSEESRMRVSVAREVSEFMDQAGICGRPMAGSNPAFDRRFLKESMPEVESKFHYRSFDMNTIYMLAGIDKDKDLPPVKHRAVDDIYRDLEILRRVQVTLE